MRRLPLIVVLLLALSGVEGLSVRIARVDAQTTKTALTLALEAELDRFPARTSIYLKHLKTGEEAAVRADESFNSASVIKVPIMVRAFQLAEERKLDLDERVTLGRADLRAGTGVFQYADLGLAPTVRDLILQMIITSDNTATDQITTRVGGVEELNAWLARSGYRMRMLNRGYEYRRKLLARLDPRLAGITAEETTGLQYALSDNPLFELYRPLFAGQRAAWVEVVRNPANRRTHAENQRKLMVEDRNYWLGDISAREIGRMLEGIERETIASPASCKTSGSFCGGSSPGLVVFPISSTSPWLTKPATAATSPTTLASSTPAPGRSSLRSWPMELRVRTVKPKIASGGSPSSSSITSTPRLRSGQAPRRNRRIGSV